MNAAIRPVRAGRRNVAVDRRSSRSAPATSIHAICARSARLLIELRRRRAPLAIGVVLRHFGDRQHRRLVRRRRIVSNGDAAGLALRAASSGGQRFPHRGRKPMLSCETMTDQRARRSSWWDRFRHAPLIGIGERNLARGMQNGTTLPGSASRARAIPSARDRRLTGLGMTTQALAWLPVTRINITQYYASTGRRPSANTRPAITLHSSPRFSPRRLLPLVLAIDIVLA
jgi:hypothetical protein